MGPVRKIQGMTIDIQMIEFRPTPNRVAVLVEIDQPITGDDGRAWITSQIGKTFLQAYDQDQMAIREFGEIMVGSDHGGSGEAALGRQ